MTKFFLVASNICRSSVWNVLHVTLLAPRMLKLLLVIRQIRAPLIYIDIDIYNAVNFCL